MKKLLKRVLTYILIFIISVICVKPMNVSAYGGFFTTDSFSKTGTWTDANNVSHAAYVMEDDTNLQTGFRYYMRVADGVAICCDGGEVIANILNYKIGLVMSTSILTNFITSYIQDTSLLGREPTFYDTHPPVLKDGDIVGIALNELTGCKMATAENSDSVNIPSDVANDVYNYYINVFVVENPESPDYIQIPTTTKSLAILHGANQTAQLNAFDNPPSTDNFKFGKDNYWDTNRQYYFSEPVYYVAYSDHWNNIINVFSLTAEKNYITYNEWLVNTTNCTLNVYGKKISDGTNLKAVYVDVTNGNTGTATNYETTVFAKNYIPYLTDKEYMTVYKNTTVITQIQNNVYSPSTYQTTNYKNYSTSNDNSYTSNVQNINNSTSNNSNIYNESRTETNETIVEDSYNVNNVTNTTTITNITNNYYGDNGAPDNGGGDDDGGDDDDDDDDSIWKALLKAIGDFLKKIGELIATVLTGIISILTSVLDAIASITTSFSAITDFLGAVFGFLPSELVAVITLGVTLGILISLIKMFGK